MKWIIKVKVDSMIMHVRQILPLPLQGGRQCSLQLLIRPRICAPGTHYGWVDWGSVEYGVCPILLYMSNTGNRTPDLLILSSTPYPLGHIWSHIWERKGLDTIHYFRKGTGVGVRKHCLNEFPWIIKTVCSCIKANILFNTIPFVLP